MKHRLVLLGTLAGMMTPLIPIGGLVHAEWRTSISGGRPILPPRFLPMRFEVERLPPVTTTPTAPAAASRRPELMPAMDQPIVWSLPLVDRELSAAAKADPLDGGLIEAMARIEPIYDPTRSDTGGAPPPMAVSPGTAMMNNVFADRWSRASLDPTVDVKVHAIAMAWQPRPVRPCDNYSKLRAHGWGDPALTSLSKDDCAALASSVRWDQAMAPVTAAPISVPVFAAPLPGSRMSSQDFWAARRAKILEIQARLHQKWEQPPSSIVAAGLRP